MSGYNDEKIRFPDTRSHQYFATLDLSRASERSNARDLGVGQGGKSLIAWRRRRRELHQRIGRLCC